MKPLHLQPHCIEDPIVLDGIRGINSVKEIKKFKGYVGGGMAVQGYLPKEEYRDTIDLDFTLLWNGRWTNFKDVMEPLVDSLKKEGYHFEYQKKGMTYEVTLSKPEGSLLLQHPRKSPGNYERNKSCLEREISNSRVLTKGGVSYSALSPEDLALHKLCRSLTFKDRYSLSFPNHCDMASLKKSADALRAELKDRWPSVEIQDVARFRLINDLLDVRCLATHAGFNKSYFEESSVDWECERANSTDFSRLLDRLEIDLSK